MQTQQAETIDVTADDTNKNHLNEQPLVLHALWPRMVAHSRDRQKLIFVMRNTERVDRVFGGDWLDTEYVNGKFVPTDQNIPSALGRMIHHTTFDFDSPITTMGKYLAQLTGRALSYRGVTPKQIVCSPALRCQQTASAIASLIGCKYCIEYGLAEPLSWLRNTETTSLLPEYLTAEKMLSLGHPADHTYNSIVSHQSLLDRRLSETEESARERIEFVLKYLGAVDRDGPLLVVGHAIALDIATSYATGRSDENDDAPLTSRDEEIVPSKERNNPLALGLRFAYGSVVTLVRSGNSVPFSYRLLRGMLPPLTYGNLFCNQPVIDIE